MNTEQIRSKKTIIILLLLLVIGIPLTVFLARKQQEIRSRASGSGVQFALSPQSATKNPGETFSVDVNINAGTFSLSGLDAKINIDKNIVEFVSFTPSTFDTVINNNYSPTSGVLRIVEINMANSTLTGTVKVGTLTLKAKAVGTGAVTVASDAQVVASGQETQIPLDASINGSYIVAEPISTPTPTSASNPTDEPTSTPIPTDIPTLTPTPTTTPIITEKPTNSPTPPSGASLKVIVGVDGIGLTSRIPLGGNTNPKHTTRDLSVSIYKATDNTRVYFAEHKFSYNPVLKKFNSTFSLPNNFPSGTYNLYIDGEAYLLARYPGSVAINKGGQTTLDLPLFNLKTGDINKTKGSENKLNILDYNLLLSCSIYSSSTTSCGLNPDYKKNSDLNDNGIVDQDDFTLFIKEVANQEGDILPQ